MKWVLPYRWRVDIIGKGYRMSLGQSAIHWRMGGGRCAMWGRTHNPKADGAAPEVRGEPEGRTAERARPDTRARTRGAARSSKSRSPDRVTSGVSNLLRHHSQTVPAMSSGPVGQAPSGYMPTAVTAPRRLSKALARQGSCLASQSAPPERRSCHRRRSPPAANPIRPAGTP